MDNPNNMNQGEATQDYETQSVINQQIARKSKTPIAIGLVLILVLVAAVYYAFKIINKPNLSDLVINTIEYYNSEQIKSGEFSFEAVMNIFSPIVASDGVAMLDSGFSEMLAGMDDLALKTSFTAQWETGENGEDIMFNNLKIEFNSESADFFKMFGVQKGEFSIMTTSDSFYLKLDSIPSLMGAMPLSATVSVNDLANQWYEIPFEIAEQMMGISFGGQNVETVGEKEKEQIKMFFAKDQVFKVEGQSKTNIDGLGNVQQVLISIDWSKLAETIIDISATYGAPMTSAEKRELANLVEQINQSPFENVIISIYVKDSIIHGIGTSGDMFDPITSEKAGSLEFTALAKNFNKKFNLAKPTNSKSILELMFMFF